MNRLYIITISVSIICGFLSGCGIGGGSLLMVCMTAFFSAEPARARIINLMYFIPTAFTALIFHRRNKSLSAAIIVPAMITGSLTAIGGTFAAALISPKLICKLFGIFMLAVGVKEILHKQQEHRLPR